MKKIISIIFTAAVLLHLSCSKKEITPEEKELFIPLSAFEVCGIKTPDDAAGSETFTKKVYFDSSYELEYEFDPGENQSDISYLSQTISVDNDEKDSVDNDKMIHTLFDAVLKAFGISMREKPGIYRYGDRSKLYVLVTKDGLEAGNILFAGSGKISYLYMEVGFTIEKTEQWKTVFDKRLDRIMKIAK